MADYGILSQMLLISRLQPYYTSFFKSPGPGFSKASETFRARKSILAHLYLETEKCTSLKLLVWREPLLILRNIWIKQLSKHKVWDYALVFRVGKLSFGTFEKGAPGHGASLPLVWVRQYNMNGCEENQTCCPRIEVRNDYTTGQTSAVQRPKGLLKG